MQPVRRTYTGISLQAAKQRELETLHAHEEKLCPAVGKLLELAVRGHYRARNSSPSCNEKRTTLPESYTGKRRDKGEFQKAEPRARRLSPRSRDCDTHAFHKASNTLPAKVHTPPRQYLFSVALAPPRPHLRAADQSHRPAPAEMIQRETNQVFPAPSKALSASLSLSPRRAIIALSSWCHMRQGGPFCASPEIKHPWISCTYRPEMKAVDN